MVIEHAILHMDPSRLDEVDTALTSAVDLIRPNQGCLGLRLGKSIENIGDYVLLIEWESVEAHTEGFRNSESFNEWRATISPYFVATPEVDHLSVLL